MVYPGMLQSAAQRFRNRDCQVSSLPYVAFNPTRQRRTNHTRTILLLFVDQRRIHFEHQGYSQLPCKPQPRHPPQAVTLVDEIWFEFSCGSPRNQSKTKIVERTDDIRVPANRPPGEPANLAQTTSQHTIPLRKGHQPHRCTQICVDGLIIRGGTANEGQLVTIIRQGSCAPVTSEARMPSSA